jgi:phosphoribosylformimino-5-aminoimidazole carboxamide ribotide isomerase
MIAIPAVDLREGACVQLVGGSYAEERVRLTNPMEVVRSWEHYGFHRLHLVDLDAATGRGSNLSLIRDILSDVNIPVQVGGGVRSDERAHTLPVDILDVVEELNGLPLGGLLVTAVHKEGQLRGTDLPLMEDVAESSLFPVYASGGVASIEDLRALEHRGLAGAVIGMALYTGAMDPVVVAGEFGE